MTPKRLASSIDWSALREQVDRLARESLGTFELSDEAAQEVLEARARSLARPLEGEAEELLQLVSFELAGERYGVETRFVLEALPSVEVAVIPGAEPPVAGICACRGRLVPLLDLRGILRHPAVDHRPRQALVLGERAPVFAVLVDAILDLLEVPVAAVQPLSGGTGGGNGYLDGVTTEAVQVIAARDLLDTYG